MPTLPHFCPLLPTFAHFCPIVLQTIDIGNMQQAETTFNAPFRLVAQRNDHIHALVAYFDVLFTTCHKVVGFSTGQHSPLWRRRPRHTLLAARTSG